MFKKSSLIALTAAGCIGFSGAASASYYHIEEDSSQDPTVEAVQAVEQTNTKVIVRTVSNTITKSLTKGMTQTFKFMKLTSAGEQVGMAAGDGFSDGLAAWATADYTSLEVDPDDNSGQVKDSDIFTAVFGMDKQVSDQMIVGAALSLGASGTDGKHSNGTEYSETSRSITFAPYVGYLINDNFAVDGTLGLTWSNLDITDNSTFTESKGETNAVTSFAAVNVNYMRQLSDMYGVKAFAGYSVMKTSMDRYTNSLGTSVADSESAHWQARLGSTLFAALDDRTEAYATAAWERDKETAEVEENAARFSLGASRILSENAILTLEGTGTAFRDSQTEMGGSINLRYSF